MKNQHDGLRQSLPLRAGLPLPEENTPLERLLPNGHFRAYDKTQKNNVPSPLQPARDSLTSQHPGFQREKLLILWRRGARILGRGRTGIL